jgi:hypothetical protein
MKSFLAVCTLVLALPLLAQTTTSSSTKSRVLNDASRLAALLQDAQTTNNVDPNTWKVVANEANSLANRLYGATGGSSTARDAALAGDSDGARTHATEAMPYVTKLIDWAS